MAIEAAKMHATVQSRRTNFLQFIALQVPRDETRRMGKLRHKVKRSYPVTFSLCETITPGDDNHLLPPQFSGRDILAFARSLPALNLRLRYDSRGDASTRSSTRLLEEAVPKISVETSMSYKITRCWFRFIKIREGLAE